MLQCLKSRADYCRYSMYVEVRRRIIVLHQHGLKLKSSMSSISSTITVHKYMSMMQRRLNVLSYPYTGCLLIKSTSSKASTYKSYLWPIMRKYSLWAHEISPHFYNLKFNNFLHRTWHLHIIFTTCVPVCWEHYATHYLVP